MYCQFQHFLLTSFEEYTNNVCWVRNTYYVEPSSQIPDSNQIRHESSIRYYQWIPFISLTQVFFCFLPYVL
ncbi:unnamed protein product [Didymodactylos carnosus]|uniref:Innexin n=1 Tax=Didymodactylos carnosus TaxID=1234261 RepID=A0A8S2S4V2_9BILA|nr:unnamed protein product [Didymodactylos carnosus]